MRDVRRREFIALLAGAAAAWPLAVRAQQPGRLPTIGFLGESTSLAQSERTAAFVQRLRELGWIEGRTVTIEYRWAEGRSERFAEIATEFVKLKVDVIVTLSTPAVIAAKQATSIGRQRHWLVDSVDRCCSQATYTLARGCPQPAPVSNHGQRR